MNEYWAITYCEPLHAWRIHCALRSESFGDKLTHVTAETFALLADRLIPVSHYDY